MFLSTEPQTPVLPRRTFFTKYWAVLLVGSIFLAVCVGLAILFMQTTQRSTITPPPPPLQGNPDGSQTEFFGLIFSGTAPIIPEKMWLARVVSFEQSNSQELLDSLVKAFELKPSPYIDAVWVGPEYSLEYDAATNEYRLSSNATITPDQVSILSPTAIPQLIAQAENTASSIFPQTSFVSFPNKTELLVGEGEFSPATETTATHLSVPFGPSFFQIPVVPEYDRALPMLIYLNARGETTKVVARPFSTKFEASTQQHALSVQEALQQIERGNASIIDSYSETTTTPKLNRVVRGDFTDATLEYRIDSTTNIMIPYYHFVGTLINNDNDIFTADVITPAVRLDQ